MTLTFPCNFLQWPLLAALPGHGLPRCAVCDYLTSEYRLERCQPPHQACPPGRPRLLPTRHWVFPFTLKVRRYTLSSTCYRLLQEWWSLSITVQRRDYSASHPARTATLVSCQTWHVYPTRSGQRLMWQVGGTDPRRCHIPHANYDGSHATVASIKPKSSNIPQTPNNLQVHASRDLRPRQRHVLCSLA